MPSLLPRAAARRTRARVRLAACLTLVGTLATAACGVPPELEAFGTTAPPRPSATATASDVPTVGPTPTPTPTGSPSPDGSTAEDCAGRPSQSQILDLLRRKNVLPRSARTTFRTGPLCAADWQYSLIEVPDRDPLQVVSTGPVNSLELVTAGNDVCSIRVRVEAPAGIRTLACD